MSETRFDSVLHELRDTAPRAPERLRDRVGALRAQPRRSVRLRPALAVAIALVLSVGLGAALIGGLTGSEPKESLARELRPVTGAELGPVTGAERAQQYGLPGELRYKAKSDTRRAPFELGLTPGSGSRLQRQDVSMRLRVDDLSRATQSAVRHTLRLGGYVASANYGTNEARGDSLLQLRVPVANVQKAIARFTDLGTILAQRISVVDLQAGVDRINRRLAAQLKVIETLEAKSDLTPAERARLEAARRTVRQLTRGRTSLERQGAYAKFSLQLTTQKAAEKQAAPGRFDKFWGDAGEILGKEAIGVLYALVIVGPFAILAALAFFAERTRRRRADHRLLEETG
jgi:Domain of unknown function (DUF4349)